MKKVIGLIVLLVAFVAIVNFAFAAPGVGLCYTKQGRLMYKYPTPTSEPFPACLHP